MKFYKSIFLLHEWAVLLPNIFSHKNKIEIYLIYWNVLLWILSDCLAFDRNPTKFYTLLTLFFGRISPGAIISHHLKTICLPFENHFFLIKNQKVGNPAIYIYAVYFPKILLSWKTTKDILFPQKCFVFAGYSANL